jgi:predicted O-methyltransferase YrrM
VGLDRIFMIKELIEKTKLLWRLPTGVEGQLCFDPEVFTVFESAPLDVLPDFEAPPGYKWKDARGRDHPRYGRFVYSFAKFYKPDHIVEVGTDTGGTAVGWAKALSENQKGRLTCVDMDAYAQNTYPRSVQINLVKIGLPPERVDLRKGNSTEVVPALSKELKGQVDIYLVDGDHRYEGALADMENGLPMMKQGGFILVHDIDRHRPMNEATPQHPAPVYEAFKDFADAHRFEWCIMKFIRKHLGVIKISA